MVNLSSSYSLIIAFSSNLRLATFSCVYVCYHFVYYVYYITAICYVVTKLQTLLLHWIVVHATTIVMSSKNISFDILSRGVPIIYRLAPCYPCFCWDLDYSRLPEFRQLQSRLWNLANFRYVIIFSCFGKITPRY